MRILVCGGRDYSDYEWVEACLNRIAEVEILIQGGAKGADALSKRWAISKGIHYAEVPAFWESGRGAGPARNYAMLLLEPKGVVAFPGGKGTAHMVRIAEKAGIKVWQPGDRK
ncbi:MAG TPA: DUF2493 domain-containing protein [Pseudoxanthomonas sp.]|nr:DUF2493 domain-containing protein [Pseudoxanthomonas sp.]